MKFFQPIPQHEQCTVCQ